MSRKNQFIGVRSRALFSVCVEKHKEETVWKCKRTVKNSNVRLDVLVVYAKMLEVSIYARKNRAVVRRLTLGALARQEWRKIARTLTS